MKLAVINHKRCDEWRAATYVWVEDSVDEAQLAEFAEKARDSYLAANQAFKDDPGAPPHVYGPQYERHPDRTVADVKAEFDAATARYKEWEAMVREARKPFSKHLEQIAGGLIKNFYEYKPELKHTVRWGHKHGEVLEFGETEVWKKDFNAPTPKEDEDYV